jgi:uncharacterized RDD family membrane protein YckC
MSAGDPGYGGGKVPPGVTNPAPAAQGPGPYRLADWGPRVVASLIDGVLICLIAAVIFVPLAAAFPFLTDSTGGVIALVLAWLGGIFIFCIALALYAPILLVKWNGQTVGKRIAGIRVIQTSGEKFDFIQAFFREGIVKGLLIALIAVFTFFLLPLINYLWPLWDAENRCLHDFLCSTRVVEA